MYETAPYFYGTGRRKSSVARVRIYQGTGKVTINDRDIDDYFGLDTLKYIVRQPLTLTGTDEKFDIVCRVSGGGVTGQAGAVPAKAGSDIKQEPFSSMIRRTSVLP